MSAQTTAPAFECRHCPQTAVTDAEADAHEHHAPGHWMREIHPDADMRSNPKDLFQCQQCPATTNLVRVAEQHEYNNEGHDVWEIEAENQ